MKGKNCGALCEVTRIARWIARPIKREKKCEFLKNLINFKGHGCVATLKSNGRINIKNIPSHFSTQREGRNEILLIVYLILGIYES